MKINNVQPSTQPFQNQQGHWKWPVFIFKRYVKKIKNKEGKYFYIISFINDGIQKEVFVPHSWLKEDAHGKGYYGNIRLNYQMSGQEMVKVKINSNEWIKYFPAHKMPRKK